MSVGKYLRMYANVDGRPVACTYCTEEWRWLRADWDIVKEVGED